jgi:transcriptional regulator with XRE-family HTH domain
MIGSRLKELRQRRGYSQEELAKLIGTTQRQVSKYEIGENQPTSSVIVAFANTLDTTTDYLLGRTDDNPSLNTGAELTETEKKIIKFYRRLDSRDQNLIVQILIDMFARTEAVIALDRADRAGLFDRDEGDTDS